jgi:hypothetical protein
LPIFVRILELPLVIKTDNTQAMRIEPDGKVGIGRNLPEADLHVEQSVDMQPVRLRLSPGGSHSLIPPHPSERGVPWDIEVDSSDLHLSTSHYQGGDVMILTKDGRVGIGTEEPDAKLQVTSTAPQIQVTNDSFSLIGVITYFRALFPVKASQN